MTQATRLSTLKASQLKYSAFLLGLPSTGTKSQLESAIRHRLAEPSTCGKNGRIVSVDMGIRNLGICILEAPHLTSSWAQTSNEKPPLKVITWKKFDVLSHLSSPAKFTETEDEEPTAISKGGRKKAISKPVIDATAFNPSLLSKTALNIAQEILSTHSLDQILIERQRFRSGGAAAVQEWTLRVNMLESMLWACFETLRSQHNNTTKNSNDFPNAYEVNPARVAKFWCSGLDTKVPESLLQEGWTPPPSVIQEAKRKIEKKDKIAVVRSWLSGSAGDDVANGSDVRITLSDEANLIADAFVSGSQRKGKKSEISQTDGKGKLDDLADCMLQGVAWIRWEENRRRIQKLMDDGP